MIGSIIGGLIAKSGADNAAAQSTAAAQQASAAAQHQAEVNRSDISPWVSGGRQAISTIGGALGFGTMYGQGGNGGTFEFDPTKQAEGLAQAQASYDNFMKLRGEAPAVPDAPKFNMLNVPQTFQADPGYAFRQSEGEKALNRTAAAKGGLLSGGAIKSALDFNSGLASQEYGNWWNRYTGGTAANNSALQQGFGNDVTRYNALYGQGRDRWADYWSSLTGLSGQGAGAQASTAGTNAGLTQASGNYLMSGANAAGQATMSGANALASGIGSGINNTLAASYLFRNQLFGGGGSSYGTPNPNLASVGGMPVGYYR